MERVISYALQASKEIKTTTKLSSGTVSVSYAAIEIVKEKIAELGNKKILLVGTGKFGNLIGNNLKNYLPGCSLFFTNRTDRKALTLAMECDAGFVPYEELASHANAADVIIVSSAAENYTVHPSFFTTSKSRLILDLSVPQNVNPAVGAIEGISLLNVDEISLILDKTISLRQAEIPKATAVINTTIDNFSAWYYKQSNNPLLRKVKTQLYELSEIHFTNQLREQEIHKTVSTLAVQLHNQNNKGCQCIHALSTYLHMN
jgi:glutamyl-tRNA reductase